MKLKYLAAFAFAVALASCDTLDKDPSNAWDSASAIQTVNDLKYAVNGVYETQTGIVAQFGNYTGDFGLFADMKGSDYKCVGGNNRLLKFQDMKLLLPATCRKQSISCSISLFHV